MDDYGREGHSHKSKHHHHQHGRHSRRHHHRHRKSSSDSNQAEYESVPVPQPPPPPPPPPPAPPTNPVKERNYKLLVDPCLVKGAKKVYRYEGVVPGEPALNVTSVKDPRPSLPRRWTLPDILDLPVPKLKIDSNYVGDPPEVEITITNLNDNIDKHFLTDLVAKHGELEEVSIYYHPVSRRHAGFARVVFSEVAAASSCVAALHSRSVMGKQLVVFFDPFGREWSRMIDNIVAPKREVLPPVDSDDESAAVQEKLKDRASITKIDISKEDTARSAPLSSAALPPEDDGGTSPFSHKTPACNPSPIAINVPAFPPPPIPANVPLPNFTQPPPPLGARPPWPIHNEWQNPNMQWRHPVPAWPPRFISPPPNMPPAPVPLPPDKENPLDLDTRIELLLKGGINGMAPPFLAMDINEESAPTAATTVEEPKPQRSRASSVSSEEEPYSPPPLPPGVDLSPTYSPKVPLPTIAEYSSDKYLPLSTPPSPFISEEEYLECLLNWRLKHLSYVQQKEKELAKRKNRQFESDKVSEISSEEDENDFKQTANNDDDRMSLSSLSSAVENIEEVAVPSNPYGSYTFGESTAQQPPPPYQQMMHPKMPPHMQGRWPEYHGQMYPGFQPGHLPYNPLHPPPLVSGQFHPYMPEQVEPVVETDPINRTVDLALDRVCELLTATLEKDLMKRMTEVLAFNEFEKWWDDEERKYNEGKKEPEKDKELAKEDPEEKKTTADVFLNSLLDSNYDGTTSGLGFRAALPKMPSFKRKQRLPSPGRGERSANFDNDKRNESDEEEMVQLSDSESRGNEPESMMRKKADYSDDSSDSSAAESSETSSDETDQESSESDIEKEFNNSKEDFLSLIDMEKLEKMRIKTPVERVTPIPSESLDFEDAKSPEESDSRASSPNRSRDLSSYAMEAFKALGLDEFVRDVKIRDDAKPKTVKPKTKPVIQETPSTSSKTTKTTRNQKAKVKIDVGKEPEPKAETKAVVSTEMKIEIPTEPIQPSVDDHDSEATLSPPEDIITVEHSYSRPKAAEVVEIPKKEHKIESWALDHDYSGPREKVEEKEVVKVKTKEPAKSKETIKDAVKSTTKERKKKSEKLVSHLLDSYLKTPPAPVRSAKRYAPRESLQEMMTCYEFLTKGVDEEDVRYLKKAFESLLSDEKQSYWLNDMHWASHPVTDLQTVNIKNKGHRSGCARTQGFYKLDPIEKQKMKHHYGKNKVPSESMQSTAEAKVWTAASREARSNQRRLLTAFGADTDSDLLKFNQLKFRKKLLKFGKSEIHDWGLFAKEPIAADEMVVEYVGQKVRPVLADYREQKYMKRGIGSSYLFRIDLENIIDATTRGNLARFINHSCNPNCYAKIITIEGSKKIVIYSKRDIKMDEEITYDYKFPLEEEKIPCLCGDALCKGFLN